MSTFDQALNQLYVALIKITRKLPTQQHARFASQILSSALQSGLATMNCRSPFFCECLQIRGLRVSIQAHRARLHGGLFFSVVRFFTTFEVFVANPLRLPHVKSSRRVVENQFFGFPDSAFGYARYREPQSYRRVDRQQTERRCLGETFQLAARRWLTRSRRQVAAVKQDRSGSKNSSNCYTNKEPRSHVDTTSNGPCICLLYTSPSPRDRTRSRMPSSA